MYTRFIRTNLEPSFHEIRREKSSRMNETDRTFCTQLAEWLLEVTHVRLAAKPQLLSPTPIKHQT